jgi:phage repressor protein C with HTH and peptisase S24 domain
MDDLNRDADAIADVLGQFMLRHPERHQLDERVATWAAMQAADRQTREERHRTVREAHACAARIRKGLLASRLEDSFPLTELVTRAAPVRGHPSSVRKVAFEVRGAPLIESAVAAGQGSDLLEEVVDTWVELPREIPKGDYIALPVVGDSMEPFLRPRDVVLVKLGSEVARDTVIVAQKNDGYVVKYVSELSDREIELTSLGSSYPVVRIPRVEHRVVGTVVARLRRSVM